MLTNSLRVKLCDFGISRLFSRREAAEAARGEAAEYSPATAYRSLAGDGVDMDDAEVDQPKRESEPLALIEQTSNCGTVRFMAPEVADKTGNHRVPYNTAADIFSLGMVYSFVWERSLPHIPGCASPVDHITALHAGGRPAHGRKTPQAAREIINKCWAADVILRPRAEQLVDLWTAQMQADGQKPSCHIE